MNNLIKQDQPKVSILITAWMESSTIAKCINSIADFNYSGINKDFEIILACPDLETFSVANDEIKKLNIENKFIYIKDPAKGKPYALNLLMDKAKGDIWIFTDGDVYFDKYAVANLIKHFSNTIQENKGLIVSGRPISADSNNNIMGYFGHLLSDAAHHKRTVDLTNNPHGKSLSFVKKRNFFPVSGYIYAITKTDIRFPLDCLVDDAYISYLVYNNGGKIEYEAESKAFVKYPKNLPDYFKQKKRSTGGYIQLWEYNIVNKDTKTRSLTRELEYFWFPINYAKNISQLIWSLCLYPIRLFLWLQIYWERKIIKKDFVKTWTRVDSTK